MYLKQKANLVINSLTESLRSLSLRSSDSTILSSKNPHTKLCYKCQTLNIASLRNSNGFTHGTLGEILVAAKSGCPLCILLEKNFDLGPPSMPVRLHGIRRILPSNLSAHPNVGDIESIRVLNGCDRDVDNPFSHTLALLTTADDIAAKSLLRRPFIEDFASEECSRLIKSWLNKCILCHPNCTINSPVISRLPTRVIRVGAHDGLEPALFTPPAGYEGAYIALSYCWGRRKNILLTKEMTKLPNMSVIFPMPVLPKTLQDAVQITRNLGFEFLWIDSLCIIQEGDDGEDLRRECITMHEVYGSATLTIAAATAGSVYEGIFQCPKTNPEMQSDCIIKYDLEDGSLGTASIVFENNQQGNDRINEPLNTRGWTFQERVLSPRTIVFYKDQVGWDCASILINSNGPLSPLTGHHKDSPGRLSDYLTSQKITRTRAASESEACMDYWRKSVEFYSRRNFTHDSDKLRAISGCAQWIKSKTGDNYLAGLWASDLRTQIFWYAEAPSSRQTLYRAPSWSWASVNGRIKFWHPDQIGNIDPVTTRLGSRTYPRIPLEVDDVRMMYSPTSNEFGDVVKGSLLIRGVLKSWKMGEGKVVATKLCMSEAGVYFDEDIDEILFCLHARGMEYFLFYPSPEDTSRYFALILRKIDETFKRVGMAASSVEAFDLYKDVQGTGEFSLNCPRVVIIE